MSRLRHITVVAVFGLTGISFMLDALRVYPRLNTISGPYFNTQLDILEGIAFLIAAFGLYRFDPRSRYFAMFLAAFSLLVGALALLFVPGVVTLLWTAAWLLVLWWLLSPSVQNRFVAATARSRTA